ncbi:nitrous oxide reductase family maturation protein NosD [uncultured Shewanella sp.]|uniref:nitrous oxide reductase family maturation protein NosD n=1 Tax=uncultured Shewanella sp. TaxID=173975 RepID=UPI00261BE123|nr:nitrous oxide reductase family maturation protein NosD [uncultured Shewanella sp.]
MTRICILAAIFSFSGLTQAGSITVFDADSLRFELENARPGDHIILKPGLYEGRFDIHRPVSVSSRGDSVIDAQGEGSAITVHASGVEVSGLTIQNWGNDQYERDAGILVMAGSDDVSINNNTLTGDGFGIRADEVKRIKINDNVVTGNASLFKLDRGDGIHLDHVVEAQVWGNVISQVRDGVYIESGSHSKVSGNRFFDQQYGIHYMYSSMDEAFNNQSYRVDGGYALMSSKQIHLHDNQVWEAIDFGILLNMSRDSLIEGNRVEQVTNPAENPVQGKEGKGIFIYGARDNRVAGNRFAYCDIGFYMAMGGEGNQVYENQFIDNFSQVKYVGDKLLEWSKDGRGNYWSGYLGWDHSSDGIGNSPYRPNDNIDRLFWLYPEANFLMGSPIVVVLRWVQRQFEIGEPSGIIDSHPLLDITPPLDFEFGVPY